MKISPSHSIPVSDSGNDVFKRVMNGNGRFVADYAAGNAGTGVIDAGAVTDPAAWQAALHLADGDPHRLTVISPTEIHVNNKPRRRK